MDFNTWKGVIFLSHVFKLLLSQKFCIENVRRNKIVLNWLNEMGMGKGHVFNKGGNSCKRQLTHCGKRTIPLSTQRQRGAVGRWPSGLWRGFRDAHLVSAEALHSCQESRPHVPSALWALQCSQGSPQDLTGRRPFHLESGSLKGKCIMTFLTIWSLKYFSSFLCKVNHLVFQVWEKK